MKSWQKKTGKDTYAFSIRWDNFVKLLESYDFLYTTNANGCWWKGNILLTNNLESFTVEIANQFLNTWKNENLPALDWKDRKKNINLSSYNKKSNYYVDFFIRETKDNGSYHLSELIGETVADWYIYGKGERVILKWKNFKEKADKENWSRKADVYLLHEAIRMGKWKYSNKPAQIISTNGKFQNQKNDSLCTNTIAPSYDLVSPTILNKLELDIEEGLFLEDTLNAHLHIPGHSLVEIIHENILNGNLTIYKNDSLNTKLTIDEFISNASLVVMSEIFYGFGKKDDTVEYQATEGDSRYYVLKSDVSQSEFIPDNYSNWMSPVEIPLYQPLQLNILDMLYTMNFDNNGLHKTYTPKAITLCIPHNINKRGILLFIGSVYWPDIKELLLKDPRAIITYKRKKVNLVDIIEQREFFQYFSKTGYMRIGN